MGEIAQIISSNTGCSRRRAEEAEAALRGKGLLIGINEVASEKEKPVKKKKEQKAACEYNVEINEVLSAKDKS